MKTSILSFLAPAAIALCALVCLPSCNPQANTSGEETAADETAFVPDSAFASIDSLATFLIEEIPDELDARYESQTSAIRSYWHFNHNGENEEQMAETVCGELKAMADKLAEGSTVDMERSGEIRCAVDRYLTDKEYCEKYDKNELYLEEMHQWLILKEQLHAFYVDLAQLANWGGTITRVNASNAMAGLAHDRLEDYSQLHKDGTFANSEMSIADARTELIQEMEDAKSLEEDAVDDPQFKETLKDLRERADSIVPLLDEWLTARGELSKTEGIPDAHTAHLIELLARRIMEMIEG